MPTEKDAAEAERIIGDYYNERNMPKTAKVHYELADAFDPPKLEWANGTVAWVTTVDDFTRVMTKVMGGWALDRGDDEWDTHDDAVTKVEPLRVLADDEIAIKRVRNANASALRLRVRTNRNNLQVSLSKVDEDVLLAVAEALEVEADEAAEETTR